MDEPKEEAFDAKASFEALSARFDALEAKMMAEEEEESGEEEEEEMSAPAEGESLAARMAALEDDNTRLRLAAYDIDEARTASLVQLHRADSVLFASIVADLPKKKADSVQTEIGSGGAGGGDHTITMASIVADGIKLGHAPRSTGFVAWAAENHMDRFDAVVEAGRNHKTEG